MFIYFDTEFTGLQKNTDLISIGMIAEDGKTFYAEFMDFDESKCDDWIKENITSELLHVRYPEIWEEGVADKQVVGTKKEVMYALNDWLQQFPEIQFVSDVCHYDFVLLIDLFGSAWDLPQNVSPVCHDVNEDIRRLWGLNDFQAFNVSREEFLEKYDRQIPDGKKHNSLYDAKVIRLCHFVIKDSEKEGGMLT